MSASRQLVIEAINSTLNLRMYVFYAFVGVVNVCVRNVYVAARTICAIAYENVVVNAYHFRPICRAWGHISVCQYVALYRYACVFIRMYIACGVYGT